MVIRTKSHPGRRRVLHAAAILTLAGCGSAPRPGARDPFTLGVAAGYPTPDGATIWTRLAPEPLAPDGAGGMARETVRVDWEVAEDERFERVVRRGVVEANATGAHSLRAEPAGLRPERVYWYRFLAEGVASPVGRFRTAPAFDATPARFKFAFASCQQFEQGYFGAYRHLVAEDPDLVVHLGDYIYESSWGRELVRRHDGPEAKTLAQYRNRYALYKSDPDLQAAHAAAAWLVTWDDHEVENDYADDRSEGLDPRDAFLRRREAAYRAWFEHMPVPSRMEPRGPDMRIFARVEWGRLARFHVLDDRQYRSPQVCPRPGRGGSNVVSDAQCPARLDPALTMLGLEQERWLDAGLERSPARWNLLAQQTLMASRAERNRQGELTYWTDGWSGYPAARRRLLEFMAARKPANPVVIGGDVHAFFVADLKADFADPRSPVVASEICGTSITSEGSARLDRLQRDNPHLKFADGTQRGYVTMTLDARRAQADLRAVDTVKRRDSTIRTAASFVVEDGRPGPQTAGS